MVYIAGPYSRGDVGANVGSALMYAEGVVEMGGVPYVPHLTHFRQIMFKHDHEWWLWYDMQWLERCDAVLRTPGVNSDGADQEEAHARKLGKPVFDSVGALEIWLKEP